MICCFMHFDFSHILRTEKYKEKVIINNGPANLFEKVHNFVVTFYLKTLQQLRPLFCQKLQFMQSSQCLKTLMIDKFFSELIWQNTNLFTELLQAIFEGSPGFNLMANVNTWRPFSSAAQASMCTFKVLNWWDFLWIGYSYKSWHLFRSKIFQRWR